jgi:hypothetical protein
MTILNVGTAAVEPASARQTNGTQGSWFLDVSDVIRFNASATEAHPFGLVELRPAGSFSFELEDRGGYSIYVGLQGLDASRNLVQARVRYAFDGTSPLEVIYPVNYDPTLLRHVVLGPQSDGTLASAGRSARITITVGDGMPWAMSECWIGYQQPL